MEEYLEEQLIGEYTYGGDVIDYIGPYEEIQSHLEERA